LGDIYLLENVGYIFCKDSVAPILLEELTKARHTTLRCSLCENVPTDLCTRTEERMIQVASLRADVLVAGVFKLSREESLELFRSRLVYIDGKITENNSGTVEEGNVISVRRHGKFRFAGVVSTSRKGKFNVKVEVYV
jgi:RNA-binding protein YlmH